MTDEEIRGALGFICFARGVLSKYDEEVERESDRFITETCPKEKSRRITRRVTRAPSI